MDTFSQLKEKLLELKYLKSTLGVLHWDQNVNMPEKGAGARASKISYLSGLVHEKFLSPEIEKLLMALKVELEVGRLNREREVVIREVLREFERDKKLPTEFVKEFAQVTAEAFSVWVRAKKESNFKIFLPHLKKIVELVRKEAELVGYNQSPYDALLDVYEPYTSTEEMEMIFAELKSFLVPFLQKIQNAPKEVTPGIIRGTFPIQKQMEFSKRVAEKMGYDFSAGRLDVSPHPFTTEFHPYDVRITTRFEEPDLMPALMATIHEAGHALYEQGIPAENFGTPLGESVSLGIHESQSRVWENIVGRGKAFWQYFYPILQSEFPEPFSKIAFEDFYRALNYVKPSLIRVEADEVTYNLHIILRFEIEKGLVEGNVAVEDLPEIWSAKMKEYLGVEVPGDAQGVLQDIHWSGGSIGYFPTYTLGNLYSAQFYEAAKRDVLNLEEELSRGEFSHFREWLRKNIHIHGKFYRAQDLVQNVTGEPLKPQYFVDYLTKKYSELYKLS